MGRISPPPPSLFLKAEVPLPFRRQVWGGVGRRSPLQRSGSRYTGERGVRRRRGSGDTLPRPPPRAEPQRTAQPNSATRGGGGGPRDDRGRGGALSAWAQLRWRGEVPGAAAASGEPARASAASRPHTAEALSVPRRGPSAGGPTHSPLPPPPPLGRGRSQREERPRAARPAAGRGPQGPGGLKGSWVPRALGPRRAQAGGTPPLFSGRRRHRLTLFATLPLSPRALKPQSPAAAQVPPPLPRHHSPPPDSHPSLRSREISCLTGPTPRETRLRTRAHPHGSARIPSLGGVSREAHAPTSVQPGFAQLAELLCHAGVRCIHFTLKSEKEELICSLSFFPLPKIRLGLTLRLRSLP